MELMRTRNGARGRAGVLCGGHGVARIVLIYTLITLTIQHD